MELNYKSIKRIKKDYKWLDKIKPGYYKFRKGKVIKVTKNNFYIKVKVREDGFLYEYPTFYGTKYNLAYSMDFFNSLKNKDYEYFKEPVYKGKCINCEGDGYINEVENWAYYGSGDFSYVTIKEKCHLCKNNRGV